MLLSHIHVLWAPFIVLSKALKVLSKDGWKALKVNCWKGGLCDLGWKALKVNCWKGGLCDLGWKALKVNCWKGGLCDPVLPTSDSGVAVPHQSWLPGTWMCPQMISLSTQRLK